MLITKEHMDLIVVNPYAEMRLIGLTSTDAKVLSDYYVEQLYTLVGTEFNDADLNMRKLTQKMYVKIISLGLNEKYPSFPIYFR